MGYQIIVQDETTRQIRDDEGKLCGFEKGKYCIFSSGVDAIVAWDMTRDEVIDFFVSLAKEDAEVRTQERLEKVDAGLPAYYQFTTPFEEALRKTLDRDDQRMREAAAESHRGLREAAARLEAAAARRDGGGGLVRG